jgi:hypothetical protein
MLLLAPLLTMGTTLLAASPKTKQICAGGLRHVQPIVAILSVVNPTPTPPPVTIGAIAVTGKLAVPAPTPIPPSPSGK